MADIVYETIQKSKRQADSGNPKGAVDTLEQYLLTDPHNPDARIQLASVQYYRLGNTDNAILQLEVVLDIEPDNIKAKKALVTILAADKKYIQKADDLFQDILKTESNAEIYFAYAHFLKMQKTDFQESAIYYKKAIELNPDSQEYHRNYAVLLLNDLRDYPNAKIELEILKKMCPNDVKISNAYSRLMRQKFDKNGNLKKGLFGRPKR